MPRQESSQKGFRQTPYEYRDWLQYCAELKKNIGGATIGRNSACHHSAYTKQKILFLFFASLFNKLLQRYKNNFEF